MVYIGVVNRPILKGVAVLIEKKGNVDTKPVETGGAL